MIAFLSLFRHILVSPFKTQARLEAEISVLLHQLNVLRRRACDYHLSHPDIFVMESAEEGDCCE